MKNTERLLGIMARLRNPDGGCPWDLEQDFSTLVPYTLEEAYEVADAVERGDFADLREELGDLLLQVVFYSQLAKERDLFDFEDVAGAISDKLIRRHPHVFADAVFADDEERMRFWEASKEIERREKGIEASGGLLEGIPPSLPALTRAQKLQKRAGSVGFDWPEIGPVFAKVLEELDELRQAAEAGDDDHTQEEVGDLLFGIVNLARHLGVDAEAALRRTNRKFTRRFHYIEERLAAEGRTVNDSSLAELDAFWDRAKRELR